MIPHHDGSELYVSNPAPALGETVDVFVRVPARIRAGRIHLRWLSDGEPVFTSAVVDRTDSTGDVWWRAAMPVRNPVTPYRFLIRTTQGVRWLTGLGLTHYDVPDSTDFRLVTHPAPPAWARDAVVYQIFPDRFARSGAAIDRETPEWATPASWDTPARNGSTTVLYGGDLDGIARRLDHVAALGADTLYLTPFFPSRSAHRYDASSFDQVDPLLGGDAALTRLAEAVHGRGMRILGDLTTNHTGRAHSWFTEQPDLYYPNEFWLGHRELPKLNWGSAELRRRFVEIVRRFSHELDGWRIDVANMTGRRGADDWTYEVARLLRAAEPDGLLIAEHAHDATGDLDRNGWHGTMNYAGFTRPIWGWLRAEELPFDDFLGVPGEVPARDAAATTATMMAFQAQMSWRSWTTSWSILGSHDTARIRTVVGSAERQEIAAGLLMTLPGTPMIFAGDEIGVTGDNNDTARQPMPWDRPDSWDGATFDRYRELIALRRAHPALTRGGLRWVAGDADTLLFLRESTDETLLVLARRKMSEPLRITDLPAGTRWENLYGGAKSLYTEPDGATAIDVYGPAFQVWAAHS
ncbi:glycoside hydrolase family 13 protein [Paractinoplanes toevensis]|uniref:Alpha-glycosidase n=1 Tax=Paractinoplanes toevensis TaxID=571911 RepID=A0A919T6T6_9ACTN|nr:glycoside hydrolase family 13 protein [Actinoplanes toevensis]GIM88631.1 alpha-glycosidase [Actinoplanes toevensis]